MTKIYSLLQIFKIVLTPLLFFYLSVSFNSLQVTAQESSGKEENSDKKQITLPELNQITVPDSPALDVLGRDITIKPSETPRAFGLSILESIGSSEGNFPQNLAIDFAPYWWFSHPNLSYDDYYSKTGFGEAILETLSLSIGGRDAMIQQEETEVEGTRLGLGLRFDLLAGQKNPALSELDPNLERQLKELRGEFLDQCVLDQTDESITEEDQEKLNECINQKRNQKWSELLKEEAKNFSELQKLRTGLRLEFASAGAFDFANNDFEAIEFSRFRTWLTASYLGTKVEKDEEGSITSSFTSPLQFVGTIKYTLDEPNDLNTESFFDLGGGIVYRFNKTPLALSLEYARRLGDEEDDRVIGVAEYRINNNYTIFASYGKTFESEFPGDGDLVTLLGLKFGAGKSQVINNILPSSTSNTETQ